MAGDDAPSGVAGCLRRVGRDDSIEVVIHTPPPPPALSLGYRDPRAGECPVLQIPTVIFLHDLSSSVDEVNGVPLIRRSLGWGYWGRRNVIDEKELSLCILPPTIGILN